MTVALQCTFSFLRNVSHVKSQLNDKYNIYSYNYRQGKKQTTLLQLQHIVRESNREMTIV